MLYHDSSVEKRLFFLFGVAVVLFTIWPSVTLFNRVQPFIAGLPPFVFFSLTVFVLVPALLFLALKRNL